MHHEWYSTVVEQSSREREERYMQLAQNGFVSLFMWKEFENDPNGHSLCEKRLIWD
jgi:hypothetical protein